MQPTSTVDIARKQRYLFLLQKVRQTKTLTAAEIRELEELEQTPKKNRDTQSEPPVIAAEKLGRRFKKGRWPGKRVSLTAATVKAAAMSADDMPAAAVMLGVAGDLGEVLAKRKLMGAWERGRLLKDIKDMAVWGANVEEATAALEMEEGRLAKLLADDMEVHDTWNQAKIKAIVVVKKSLMEQTLAGKPTAARQIEKILMHEIARPQTDFHRLTTEQLAAITSKTRQTIHAWFDRHGMPRNNDKTYDLCRFIEWYEGYIAERATQSPGRFREPELNELQARKAQKLEIEIAHQRCELVERGAVLAGLISRYQTIINYCNRKAGELATLCEGQPAEKSTHVIKDFFDELRKTMCYVPEELKLPDGLSQKFLEILEELAADNTQQETA